MPVVIEYTLKKDGSGDYTTINSWLAAEVVGYDFVANDTVKRLRIFKAGWEAATPLVETFLEFGSTTVTDATRRPEITCEGAERHNFKKGTGFVLTLDAQFGFVLRGNHALISGVELANCSTSDVLWFQEQNCVWEDSLSYGHTTSKGAYQAIANRVIFFDYPNVSTQAGVMVDEPAVLANCTAILRTGQGFLLDIAFRRVVATDCIVYKEQAKTTYDAFFQIKAGSDYCGTNRANEGVDGLTNNRTDLSTTDFVDFANHDYKIKLTSAFSTAGSGGGVMGTAVAGAAPSLAISVIMQSYRQRRV